MLKTITAALAICLSIHVIGQESICPNAENAKDHSILSAYKGSCIIGVKETKFDALTLPISAVSTKGTEKTVAVEGKVTDLIYGLENSSKATVLEVQRNYESALKSSGLEITFSGFGKKSFMPYRPLTSTYPMMGSTDYLNTFEMQKMKYFRFAFSSHNKNQNNDYAYFVAQGKKDGIDYTLAIYLLYNRTTWEGLTDNIFVFAKIIESESMETGQVSIASIEDKITNEGKEVFHNILFDFGSDQLTAESYAVIETLADYLKQNSAKKYYIVGHTDNVGALQSNQTLSEKRARSVLTALTSKYGVSTSQLSAHGVGQLSPLAINTTEEGRALNRRVEVVLN